MSVESYAHKAAKATVVGWLRAAADIPDDRWVTAAGINWRPNRGAPHFGVWEEYPILPDRSGVSPVWDETTLSRSDEEFHALGSEFLEEPPTYGYLKTIGHTPGAILDVAVQHKGTITVGIEIVHKHPPSSKKLDFLRFCHLQELLILPAKWVLGQVAPPVHVPREFWAWR